MKSGKFGRSRDHRYPIHLSATRLLSIRPLPWKLNEGHPGPACVLSGQGIASAVSLHENHAIGSLFGKNGGLEKS